MKYFFFSIALISILTGCMNSTAEENTVANVETITPTPPPGQPEPSNEVATVSTAVTSQSSTNLPSFRMVNTLNQVIDISQFKGKKVFVNLWATWCPPCRAEIPSIEKLAAKTDKNKAAFIMLSLDDNFDKARNYALNNNMKLPVYYLAGNLPQLFSVDGIPATFIFNEKGELIHQQVGSTNFDTVQFMNMMNL
jgi:thiol-disulfide isomerase/thioredoxin